MSALLGRTSSDEELGRRLAHGEAPAFDELYRRYAHRLAAYGTHLLGDAAAGDDVAQVTLMRAYQALREGRVPDALGSWLYRTAHNAAIDTVRRRRELPTALLPEHGGDQQPAAEVGALTAAIAALPERQRRVFVLRELHGLRIGEAAAELGLSNAQVEQALFAARNRLAEQLVFGERLSCPAVQRLAAGPLDGRERRALKTHLRSCRSCRKQLGLRGVALSLPLPPLGWLRHGGTPAVAKLGLAATAVVAVSLPLVALRPYPSVAAARPVVITGPDVPLELAAARAGASSILQARPRRKAKRHVVRRIAFVPTPTPAPFVPVHVTPAATPTRQSGRSGSDGGGGGRDMSGGGGGSGSSDGSGDSGGTSTSDG